MIEKDLEIETKKWLERIQDKRKQVKQPETEKQKKFIENIDAYISDSKYFLENNDLIRAFEAVVWAWAWIEIGQDNDII